MSGTKLEIPCTIVMPEGTPSIKVRSVSRLGAKVVLHGQDFDEAKVECIRLAKLHNLAFVPPYDDPLVIAGQGTIGMEILKQIPDSESLDAVFAAVGGGGLVAGIAEYIKRIGSPSTQIFGAETVDGDAMEKSLQNGARVTLSEVGPFADGTAVKIVGEEPFRICKTLLDGVVKANTDELCAAIKDVFEGLSLTILIPSSNTPPLMPDFSPDRNPVHNRASRRCQPGMPEALHHRQQPRRVWKALRRCNQRCKHELRQAAFRCGACRAW